MIHSGVVLGHEIAGRVVEVAGGIENLSPGDLVAVHPVWSCGRCRQCVAGRENACLRTGGRMFPAATPGISVNGGMAEFVAVPASALVQANGVDPALAAVLPDAGLVPYHSINAASDLLRPGSTAVIIGVGGLGPFSSDATDAAERVLEAAGGYGADFVLDLVGNATTLKLAGDVVAPYGAIRVPGLGDGLFEFETSQLATSLPWGASITRPYSGTHQDLHDLVALAKTHAIDVNLVRYSFDDALTAFDDLEAGTINGRAVIVMS
jgi:propanol-preferring alcohol dehydrogenase